MESGAGSIPTQQAQEFACSWPRFDATPHRTPRPDATVNTPIKLSAPATREFWEIPVLFEDEHLLVLDKPPRLLTSRDRLEPDRPDLITLLHTGIEQGKPWAKERGLSYLAAALRLDPEASGVFLLARSKLALIALANLFGSDKSPITYTVLAQGTPEAEQFVIDAPIGPHPTRPGLMRVEPRRGKRSRTEVELAERFLGYSLLKCRPVPGRLHQLRVHLRHAGHLVVGDTLYGGKPLLLSRLKSSYRYRQDREERPLISQAALHAECLELSHPVTGNPLVITAPWPKDLKVAVKYLRRYAGAVGTGNDGPEDGDSPCADHVGTPS